MDEELSRTDLLNLVNYYKQKADHWELQAQVWQSRFQILSQKESEKEPEVAETA